MRLCEVCGFAGEVHYKIEEGKGPLLCLKCKDLKIVEDDMPDVGDFYSMRLTPADVKPGDMLTINSPGSIVTFKDKHSGKDATRVRLDLMLPNRKIKEYLVNGTSFKAISEQWGTNTDKWVGKTVTASIGVLPTGNKVIYLFPAEDRGAGVHEVRDADVPF